MRERIQIAEDQEITRTMKDVVTESIRFWQLKNEELQQIEDTNILMNDQCYVVRWQYRIQLSGQFLPSSKDEVIRSPSAEDRRGEREGDRQGTGGLLLLAGKTDDGQAAGAVCTETESHG